MFLRLYNKEIISAFAIYKPIIKKQFWAGTVFIIKNQNDNEIHKQVYSNRKANIMCIIHCMVAQQHANTDSSHK